MHARKGSVSDAKTKTPESTVADSAVSVSLSLSRVIFFTTSDLLAITVTHVQPSAHAGERAPLDDAVIKNGNGGCARWTNYSQ